MSSFAVGDDKGLENAIKIAKEKFDIPDNYKFDYGVNTQDEKNIWNLRWYSKDDGNSGINVNIDDKGTILNYYCYKPYDYTQQKKLPKVGKNEAKDIADSFIKKINPGILSKIQYQDNNRNVLYEREYYFNYARVQNGIPFYNNSISVSVNSETGEVQSYHYNWTDDLIFPSLQKAINMSQAENAYMEKLGFRLVYNYTVEDENVKIYPVYVPKFNNYQYAVDAFTGEKIILENGYYGPYFDRGMGAGDIAFSKTNEAKQETVSLTPDELKAVEDVSKLLTSEQAEKKAREWKVLELDDGFKLSYSYLTRSWPVKDSFVWNLNFEKVPVGEDKQYRYAGVTLDATTGEFKNFYISTSYNDTDIAKYDEAASKAAVEKFLKEFKPVEFGQVVFDDTYTNNIPRYISKEAPKEYYFNYIRNVNGVTFPGNTISIRYDAVNGKVASFDMSWFNADFPSVENVLSLDAIHQNVFKEVGLELQYKAIYPEPDYSKPYSRAIVKPDIKLVYSLKEGKPYNFDANTGDILDYNGKPFKENKPIEYSDIKGNFAEKEIQLLAEYGIALEGTEFKPGQQILQKEFFTLLSKTLNYYYGPYIAENSSNKEIDELYNYMMREGIVKKDEKSPESSLSREDAVKFIIRAMKYDKVADIKGIYKSLFKDEDSINPDLLGYIAIAKGLNIVKGSDGYFNPKDKLTRAEAAVIIYNYLQR